VGRGKRDLVCSSRTSGKFLLDDKKDWSSTVLKDALIVFERIFFHHEWNHAGFKKKRQKKN
jgi:hypothetical protein